ncbi:unnamed protein product [Caenorhabditis bovis]|uniref:NLGase n=1 Tax=Caenorhabditis bovis TaxID=2654633 RepID=A0A8S1FD50_9PELO|nr:unnamed protein product [Caenorhabditis bovis]
MRVSGPLECLQDVRTTHGNGGRSGLYPRSWTTYRIPELGLTVTIRQVSPIIPHDYEDSSLPVCVFSVEVENASPDRAYTVSVAFTFRNGTGNRRWDRESECSAAKYLAAGHDDKAKVNGIALFHSVSGMRCIYGLATTLQRDVETSICQRFDPSKSGRAFWTTLEQTGNVPHYDSECCQNSREMAVGVCNKFELAPGKRKTVDYALSWDMPKVNFGSLQRSYQRRYTKFFRSVDAADALCVRALRRFAIWEQKIDEWQSPIIGHPKLPDWYKAALFNELYFITDGGTVWFEFDDSWSQRETHLSEYTKKLMKATGRFGYLESWEYRMVNTYDVHFYASYALAELWPNLELAVQAEFTDQVYHSIEKPIRFHMEGDVANLKTASRVPHDLGNPADEPWLATNAYVMHDTGKWKDLNMKYVLTSWRDYIVLSNEHDDFLNHTWPMIMTEALENWDQDKDGMIENFGKADQTYDAWQMEGVSAYCGSLWLASLRVAVEMAKIVGDDNTRVMLAETMEKAKLVFVEKLWTGTYFRFCERSRSRETVMADQLCGYWFLQSVSPDMANDIIAHEMVQTAINTIYDLNVCSFAKGKMGAVNGMKPNGIVDREYIQADEVWTGVTYAVASLMIQQGEIDKAFHTASGCYLTCFERAGLQYQTPEAIYERKYYRAIGYMRPLAIWAMQWSLKRHCGLNTNDEKLPQMNGEASLKGDSATSEDSSSLGYVSDFRDDERLVVPKVVRTPA